MSSASDTAAVLFEQLRPRLTAISRRIIGNAADAEDIVQDCFLKWHGAERERLATPAAWLTTVVQRQSIDRLRKRARDAAAAQGAMALAFEAPSALPEDDLLLRAELGEAFMRLLSRLSPAERLALVLHEVFECGHADIAAVLGTRTVNARQHLARARRRLRQTAGEASPDEKLCHELVRRFQAAINGLDLPAVVSLLGEAQPVFVQEAPQLRAGLRMRAGACANDARYRIALAA